MNNLLRSGFSRLLKSKSLWICTAAMGVLSAHLCLDGYWDKVRFGQDVSPDSIFMQGYLVAGALIAVVCSLFIGTEYGDGTIRNKLVVGQSRSALYLSSFITCAAAGLMMTLTYLGVTLGLGSALLDGFQTELPALLSMTLTGLLLTVSSAAIFTLLSMLNQNKALASILNILLAFALIILAGYLYGRMLAPEFHQPYMMVVDGVVQQGEAVPNPDYLNDVQRAWAGFFVDFLPTGQAIRLFEMKAPHPILAPAYSVLLILLTNAAGVFLFRRKDLK